jgi:hypothetical protein
VIPAHIGAVALCGKPPLVPWERTCDECKDIFDELSRDKDFGLFTRIDKTLAKPSTATE